MEILLANVNNIDFKIERDLIEQIGAVALPFFGMDKSMAAVCQFVSTQNGLECEKGSSCPFRHIRGDRTIVCKHWLRGLCKKGDQCEFLHEYDMKKMPECYFYSRFNACHNKECPFLHIDPESKVKDCPWYDRGFCRHGPHCRHRHVRRVLCSNYLAGFCENGWNCKFMHPRFELPPISDTTKEILLKKVPTCHFCGELGHKASACKKNPDANESSENRFKFNGFQKQNQAYSFKENTEGKNGTEQVSSSNNFTKVPKPLDEITCYKCGNKGHYANKCPKGHLAFLSNQRSHK
ncbi:PREDICTED: cleavage and polyadenylation specificity factor subunit 4 [Bactrocera latifrons]|nr:PREDICTED: cleavage and polyadenylation specificity factor subunit 4 [Bactrocera latifrons]